MILPIVQYGDPVLRVKCRDIETIDETITTLIDQMLETMRDAHGVGLAAPQIGQDLNLAVIDVSHDPECVSYLRVNGKVSSLEAIMPLILINPELTYGEEKGFDNEGCLSIQGVRSSVKRPLEVSVTFQTPSGETMTIQSDGLLARAIQHEYDHLQGILFIDRLAPVTKIQVLNRMKRLRGKQR